MKIISKKELLENKNFYLSEIKNGKIFVYPTDTIYGLGCNALNFKSVNKIREIKNRDYKPFSIIVPSFEWIQENLENNNFQKNILQRYLPGKYTFILKSNNSNISKINNLELIGIRIPDNWFYSDFLADLNVPIVSTSVNLTGQSFAKNIKQIPKSILGSIDFIIDEGELNNNPSKVIDLSQGEFKVLRN